MWFCLNLLVWSCFVRCVEGKWVWLIHLTPALLLTAAVGQKSFQSLITCTENRVELYSLLIFVFVAVPFVFLCIIIEWQILEHFDTKSTSSFLVEAVLHTIKKTLVVTHYLFLTRQFSFITGVATWYMKNTNFILWGFPLFKLYDHKWKYIRHVHA